MKLFIIVILALGTTAAAILQPDRPFPPSTHTIAIESYNSTSTHETQLIPTQGEPTHPSPASINNANPRTPTLPKAARVTQLTRPNDPEPIIILPFHFQLLETCMADDTLAARAVYVNRDFTYAYWLSSSETSVVHHHVYGFPNRFLVGPYDYVGGKVRFSWENTAFACVWDDGEAWRECGECRAGTWSAGELDCGGGDIKSRKKDMDCSFIMGWKSELTGTPIPNLPQSDDPNY
ncbi:hypothetical protein G6011_09313 [Alternaria panax]|uniref:Uncharacterized protein n=1 Tax=Alternaria panax TaxID=48097 RepID=A0AAD4IAS4_9PLEO|nr:hypothetical protein G6011_09313 [Alternaria panax]